MARPGTREFTPPAQGENQDWILVLKDASPDNTLARWAADLQNDFRARMDWCVKPRGGANHRPNAVLNGRSGREVLRQEAEPGSVVELDSQGSRDPDGDAITSEWLVYGAAGTYAGETQLTATGGPTTRFTVPDDPMRGALRFVHRTSMSVLSPWVAFSPLQQGGSVRGTESRPWPIMSGLPKRTDRPWLALVFW